MKPAPCPRLFEAEAMRDGRLAGAERASFERHTNVCSACAREVEALEALAEALRASPPDHADELRVRRERTRLLAAFDRELLAPESPRAGRRWLVWPAAVVAVLAAGLVLWRVRRLGEPVLQPGAVIHADSSAAWSERIEGGRDVVVLEHGALWIHVDHATSTRGLVVLLPDGELEDTGTTFTVSAEDGRTTRVAVQEGSVRLRVRGQPPIAIGSGGVWTPTVPPPLVSSCASSAPSSEPVPRSPRVSPPARSAPPPAPLPSGLVRDPSMDFRDAMSALDRGDNREAAAEFARFLAKHPHDARAEDAAYLRVIALQRCGDDGGMREAALDYLRRYPAGFRRAEVETLSR